MLTWRLATCPVTSTLHVGCNTHITVTGRSDSVTGTNQQQEQQWSVWHVVISCSHTGSTQCVSTLTTAGCLRKHVVKKQVYLQPITAPVSQGVTEGSLLSALRFITLPLRHMIRWWHDLHLHQSCTESCCPDKGPVREPQSQSRPQICLFIFPPPYVCFSEA